MTKYVGKFTPDEWFEYRFWRSVSKGPEDMCWLWTAGKNPHGYGMIKDQYRVNHTAHRLSYVLHHGEIPKDKVVMHICDNRACVNPNHLKLGTQTENIRDMFAKGRSRSPFHKGLTIEDARKIRASKTTGRALAKLYGVSESAISKIRSGVLHPEK